MQSTCRQENLKACPNIPLEKNLLPAGLTNVFKYEHKAQQRGLTQLLLPDLDYNNKYLDYNNKYFQEFYIR